MTKTLYILCRHPDLFTHQRLAQEAVNLGAQTVFIKVDHLALGHGSAGPTPFPSGFAEKSAVLRRDTGVDYDDFALAVARRAQDTGYKVSNPVSAVENLRDKHRQAEFLGRNSLPTPPTLVIRGRPEGELLESIKTWIGQHAGLDECFILKTVRGNQGVGVSLLRGTDSLYGMLETLWGMRDQRFILQPFISSTGEFRLFFAGGECLGAIEKTLRPGEFRGNAKRADLRFLPVSSLPQEVISTATKAFLAAGLDYSGLDLIMGTDGQVRILEINTVPGIEAFEECSGKNVARSILGPLFK